MMYDHLVVGQGIAGSLLAYRLLKQNRKVMVIGSSREGDASRVAAGMFTPVSGKRMVKTWMADELLNALRETYAQLEKELHASFFHPLPIHQSFSNIKEQNDLFGKLDQESFAKYIDTDILADAGVQAPFGVFGISGSGWVNTQVLLHHTQQWLLKNEAYIDDMFDHSLLQEKDEHWCYKDVKAKQVIFCEGHAITQNPFFSYLPVEGCKGDVFLLKSEQLGTQKIYKRGAYTVPLGDQVFKAGSTYNYRFTSPAPDETGYAELKHKTDQLIDGDYEIQKHITGIRPTVKDRKPLLGGHPQHKGLYVFNGLGTKGILYAPYFSQMMCDLLLKNEPVKKEVNVERYLDLANRL